VGGQEEEVIAEQEKYIINTSPKEKKIMEKIWLFGKRLQYFSHIVYTWISVTLLL